MSTTTSTPKSAPEVRTRDDRTEFEIPDELEEQSGAERLRAREVRRLVSYLLGHPGLLWGGMVLILLATAAGLLEPRIFGYAVDEAILPRDEAKLLRFVGIFLFVECLRAAATIGQSYLFTLLGQRVMQRLRLELLSHLQRLDMATIDRNPAGKLVTRVTNDISSLAEMFSAGFVSIVANILTVLGILIWLFMLDFRLAAVSVAIFPVLVWASIRFSSLLRVAYRQARSRLSALNAFLAEIIMGMKTIQLFGQEKRQLARYRFINDSYSDAQYGSVRVFALFQPSITLASGIAMAALVAYGGHRVRDGVLPVGVLVAFYAYVIALFQPIREIADKWNLFLSGMASAERIFSILQWPVEIRRLPDLPLERSALPVLRGEIVFEGVWFAYSGEDWVLKNFNCRIAAGARVGVVGHTGAGKSTLISLLLRFYEPSRGRILVDGRDVREYDRRELRARIGMIQQDVFLFSGSLHENITLFRDLPGESVELPPGLEERDLYERGVNLSMGERQKLAFHRACASRPDLWILDEATANVDSATEAEMTTLLKSQAAGRTQILVAHRLATIRDADQILVLHRGELVEQGNHRELQAAGGLYSKLVELQRVSVDSRE